MSIINIYNLFNQIAGVWGNVNLVREILLSDKVSVLSTIGDIHLESANRAFQDAKRCNNQQEKDKHIMSGVTCLRTGFIAYKSHANNYNPLLNFITGHRASLWGKAHICASLVAGGFRSLNLSENVKDYLGEARKALDLKLKDAVQGDGHDWNILHEQVYAFSKLYKVGTSKELQLSYGTYDRKCLVCAKSHCPECGYSFEYAQGVHYATCHRGCCKSFRFKCPKCQHHY
jgi:hypothetical protein